jgi:hypothetical protein
LETTSEFVAFATSAHRRPLEVSLRQLLEALPRPASGFLLDRVQRVQEQVVAFDLELIPTTFGTDLVAPLILRARTAPTESLDAILTDITRGESEQREFKSSFQFDHARAAAKPETPLEELKSQSVRWATLKTIAAFLNSGGGVLYVGVDDAGSCIGVAKDLLLLKMGYQTIDGLELAFRDSVKTSFASGSQVNDYLRGCWVEVRHALYVFRVEVSSRSALSFLKDEKGVHHLFRRQGNRTDEVPIQDVEAFLALRRDRRLSV